MAFKMKGFSGFGNSPIKKEEVSQKTALEGLAEGATNILKPDTTKTKSVKYDIHGYPIGTRRVDPDGYVYTTDKYGNKIYTQKKDNVKTTKPVKRRPPSDI